MHNFAPNFHIDGRKTLPHTAVLFDFYCVMLYAIKIYVDDILISQFNIKHCCDNLCLQNINKNQGRKRTFSSIRK